MDHQINSDIRAKEVRLISSEGEQLGIKPLKEALMIAEEENLDLVNVAPTSTPPVCRIMDYGKFLFENKKKAKEARKNQKVVELKEIRFTPNTDEHDYQTKSRNIKRFLQNGNKVKVAVRFRGREIMHTENGRRILDRLAQEVGEFSSLERQPAFEGKNMIMILNPKEIA
ncbi:translation initiation factor IF-3 [Brevibacillus sp. NPDC058079]|uniref:translation initiation factor IF-3 n=1 Tax=Brevibacillus sp. NPDC058079 TaxID=3346330 RepID=UPI0036DFF1EA